MGAWNDFWRLIRTVVAATGEGQSAAPAKQVAPETSSSEVIQVTRISERAGVRKLKIPIVGESHHNEDGIARQFLIEKLKPGHVIRLVREPGNPYDPNAIAVYCTRGQIGYLGREHARQLSPILDSGAKIKSEVSNVWGGDARRPSRGVWIWIWDDPRQARE